MLKQKRAVILVLVIVIIAAVGIGLIISSKSVGIIGGCDGPVIIIASPENRVTDVIYGLTADLLHRNSHSSKL